MPAAAARLQEASPAADSPPEDASGAMVDPGHLRDVAPRMSLHVGVLHYDPGLELCPLLADPLKCVLSQKAGSRTQGAGSRASQTSTSTD